jgi:hypothetical protein
MIMITTQGGLAPAESKAVVIQPSYFNQPVLVERAPWLYSALARLSELYQDGRDIPGFGNFKIDASTTAAVRKILAQVGKFADLPIPNIGVFSGGGVSVTWIMGERQVTYSFWPEGTLTYSKEVGGEISEDDEVPPGGPFDPTKALDWLLAK